MAKFVGKPSVSKRPAAEVAAKFDDLTVLQDLMDRLPEDQRAKIGDISFTKDDVNIPVPQMGPVTLRVTERRPDLITFDAVGVPVPLNLYVHINPLGENETEVSAEIEVDIPAFLKPMIGGTMQRAVDQFGQMMAMLS